MPDVVLSLGTNVGPRERWMALMLAGIDVILENPRKRSKIMETSPVGVSSEHGWYLNCVVRGGYRGEAHELLEHCRQIERQLGRTNKGMLKPRTADIDILLYGEEVIASEVLLVPHPGILSRRFCLEGLNEVAPEMHHPVLRRTFRELREKMSDSVARQEIRFIEG